MNLPRPIAISLAALFAATLGGIAVAPPQQVTAATAGSVGRSAATTPVRPLVTTTQTQVLSDPGFEATTSSGNQTTNTSWQQYSSGGVPTIDEVMPFQGNWSADLCNYDNCLDEVAQGFVAPAQVTDAQLQFVYAIASGEVNGNGACHDRLRVGMAIAGQLDASSAAQLCQQTGNGTQYQGYTQDVTGWVQQHPGQQVQVMAQGTTDNLNVTDFFVDQVTLLITYATTPSAPQNVKATSSGSQTATVSWQTPQYSGTSPISSYTITAYIDGTAQSNTTVSAPNTSGQVTGLTNGAAYTFIVTANNESGAGYGSARSNSVTPDSWNPMPAQRTFAVSTQQYHLPNSDGVTWQDMDMTNLSLSFTPGANGNALLTANTDLWTATAGVNQDVGIAVQSSDGTFSDQLVGWKESGGQGATFSPTAAALQVSIPVTSGITYGVKLRWRGTALANGLIYAGAGTGSPYSPTRLSVQQPVPYGEGNGHSAASTSQYTMSSNDGSSWQYMDGQGTAVSGPLRFTVTPGVSAVAVLSANADLFTSAAGKNQDLGIFVLPVGAPAMPANQVGAPALAGWVEAGGNSGVYSPNAAYLQAVYPLIAGQQYLIALVWKCNTPLSGSPIYAGAGSSSPYSPTRLTALLYPSPTANQTPQWNVSGVSSSTQQTPNTAPRQFSLANSDGSTWQPLNGVSIVYSQPSAGTVVLSANSDLFVDHAGFNQDIGIQVNSSDGAYQGQIVAWKESGGAGVYSPNAATVQTTLNLSANTTYTVRLVWKTNRSASGVIIYAGAGPFYGVYSPTSLEVLQS